MIQLFKDKQKTLASAAPGMDLVLLSGCGGYHAYLKMAVTIHDLTGMGVIKNYGNPDEFEDAHELFIPLDEMPAVLKKLNEKHSVGLVDVIPTTDQMLAKYVCFIRLPRAKKEEEEVW